MSRLLALLLTALALGRSTTAADSEWVSLIPDIDGSRDAVAGEWRRDDESLTVAAAAGARLSLPVEPTGDYDFRVSFTRRSGVHSIALIFIHGGRQATLEVDAWGQHLAGFQSLGGSDLRANPTRQEGPALENGRRYVLTVEVRRDRVRGLLDGEVIAEHQTDGSDLSMVNVWRMPQARRLGIGAWDSQTVFHRIEVRSVGDKSLTIARTEPAPARTGPSRPTPMPTPMPDSPQERTNARGKRVLLVIANQDFFYREYGDPRQELERAGVKVTVAAGRKAPCRPHQNSGEGGDGGVVQPDLALANVRSQDFDAILFSGGWGASAYQFAFPGRYSNAAYNGDRQVKTEVNRLINEFLGQDKYVCALCNGVSILAW
ncbi:MAG: DJ-1/PfpI family protein, partial [Planctomycetaceae bacterium]|nr:DJ-1/PfpI family protein [Planctomycetaceae bacterium]